MGFREFTETGSRKKEFISITSNKTFGLSRNFLDAYRIAEYHKATIYYDSDEKKIALYFTPFDVKNGINVRIPDPRYGGTIVAKSFFDLEKIDTSIYGGRYDNIEKIDPSELGASPAGDAFVFTLKRKPVQEIEDIDDRPIDLSEIPF